jgi:hypothetical protein
VVIFIMPEFQFDGEVMQRKPNSPDDGEAVPIRREVAIHKDAPRMMEK